MARFARESSPRVCRGTAETDTAQRALVEAILDADSELEAARARRVLRDFFEAFDARTPAQGKEER